MCVADVDSLAAGDSLVVGVLLRDGVCVGDVDSLAAGDSLGDKVGLADREGLSEVAACMGTSRQHTAVTQPPSLCLPTLVSSPFHGPLENIWWPYKP